MGVDVCYACDLKCITCDKDADNCVEFADSKLTPHCVTPIQKVISMMESMLIINHLHPNIHIIHNHGYLDIYCFFYTTKYIYVEEEPM